MTSPSRRHAPRFRECFLTAQDGLRLYYRDYPARRRDGAGGAAPGAGPAPLLCLPGLTRNSKDFHALATRHAVTRRVICPDYRGRGRSEYDPNWRNYTAASYVEDIRHLLAALNIHHVVVVGTSLGGLLAMALAAATPTVLAGAVLNDVGPTLDPEGISRIVAYIRHGRTQPDWETAARNLRACFPNLSIDSDAGWLEMARRTYREGRDGRLHFDWDTRLVKPLLRGRPPLPDLWALFRAMRRLPVLAIRGALSDVLGEATFARMAAEKPDLVRVTVPGVGHAPSLGEAEAAAAIDAFLAGL